MSNTSNTLFDLRRSIDICPVSSRDDRKAAGFLFVYQTLKAFLMLPVEFISRAEIYRYLVLDDTIYGRLGFDYY